MVRLLLVLVTVALFVTSAASAQAAPGDSAAVGFLADLSVQVVGGGDVTIDDRLGEVTAPPDDSATLVGADTVISADLGPLGPQTIAQAALIQTTATSSATGSAASAEVTGAEINTAGGILAIDAVSAQVSCPTAGTPSASVTPPATVTLNGVPVVLDADGETVITFDPGPGTVTLTLTVDQRTTTSNSAAATAFVFGLQQHFPGIVTATGTLTLAQTSCETPTPAPTASSLTPVSGPTAGGTTVTVTGTGFVPGATTVTIGTTTVPASAVTVAPDGTSLTFTTPPGPAGPTTVTVTTPAGTTPGLRYTYAAPPPASNDPPVTAVSTSLAATGTSWVPMAFGLGTCLLLAGAAILALARGDRRHN